jgi:putative transposase
MSRVQRLEFSGALYHVIARGNEQREVFRDDSDRDLYLERLAHYRDRFRFRLYAYCLMTNHVHLALEVGPVPLSRIVLALHGSYAQRFNQRHQRVGHLFQGRYKAILVQKTAYLLTLIRYIHENPVKAGIVREPSLYRWSSDRFYRSEHPPDWLDTRGLLELLGADPGRAARRYGAWIGRPEAESYEDLKLIAHIVKGDQAFAQTAFKNARESERRRSWSVEQIARAAAAKAGIAVEELRVRALNGDRARLRGVVGHLAWKHGRISLTKVAEFFRRDGSTLVRDVQKFESELRRRPALRKDLAEILGKLDSV